MLRKTAPRGAMTAVITPFNKGEIDYECYEALIKRQARNGIDAIVALGSTGEAGVLSSSEHHRCIEVATRVAHDAGIKVVAGCGGSSTQKTIELIKSIEDIGVDAIMVVTPFYNKPNQRGMYEHFKAVALSTRLDIILYNVPGRTGVSLDINTATELFAKCENIYGLKDASGDVSRIFAMKKSASEMAYFSGEDMLNLPLLASGADGVISVCSNILPDMIASLTHASLSGDIKRAREINLVLYDMYKALFLDSNPIPIKAALYLARLLPRLEYRLPLLAPEGELIKRLQQTLDKYEVKE